jgi:hypothetical protein
MYYQSTIYYCNLQSSFFRIRKDNTEMCKKFSAIKLIEAGMKKKIVPCVF